MRKTLVFLGAIASAAAFSTVPAGLPLRRPAVRAGRNSATAINMADPASLLVAASPGVAALTALSRGRLGSLGSVAAPQPTPTAAPVTIDTSLARVSQCVCGDVLSSTLPCNLQFLIPKPPILVLLRLNGTVLLQANFKRWNDALQTKNAATVANMYTFHPSFLPTVSGDHITMGGTGTDTEAYFVEFVKKNPFGTITDDVVQVYSDDAYLHSGLYTFELGQGAARAPVEARFSYVWKRVGGEWKISHHHSSVRPGA